MINLRAGEVARLLAVLLLFLRLPRDMPEDSAFFSFGSPVVGEAVVSVEA